MKITSRLGVLLAKIAGKEASLDHMVPPWATNAEEELMLDIADRVDGLEAGAVPEVAAADKGKYLHANESTGTLEWAEGGSSGSGVLVVGMDMATYALDKTWQEIHDAPYAVIIFEADEAKQILYIATIATIDSDAYQIDAFAPAAEGAITLFTFLAESASGYPVLQMGD